MKRSEFIPTRLWVPTAAGSPPSLRPLGDPQCRTDSGVPVPPCPPGVPSGLRGRAALRGRLRGARGDRVGSGSPELVTATGSKRRRQPRDFGTGQEDEEEEEEDEQPGAASRPDKSPFV